LYAANRIHNAVAAFAVAADGQLRLLSETWARADSPRCLTIEPGGDFLYSCNQKGDSITSFRISAANGALQFTGRFEPVGSPTFMTVIKARST
jgi:6-phosphogluconolactonase (cycloisomerase 2 family)